MAIKTTIVMSQGFYTWTESHYQRNTSTLTPDFGSGTSPSTNNAIALANARAALLGQGASIVRLRNSDTTLPRSSQVVPQNDYQNAGPYVGVAGSDTLWSQDPNSVVLMHASSLGFVYNKNWYLSGIPDGVIDTEPTTQIPDGLNFLNAFTNPYQTYVNLLTSAWNFRVGGAANALSQVLAVVPSAQFPNTVGIQVAGPLAGAPAPTNGNYPPFEVNLTGFRRSNTRVPGLSGTYQVVGVIPPTNLVNTYTYFLGETGNVVISNLTKIGGARVQNFSYVQYSQITPTRAGHRKRGVRTGRPLGRSKSRI